MDRSTLAKFQNYFEQQREQISVTIDDVSKTLQLQPEDLADETDLSQSEMAASLRVRLKSRDAHFLRKIDTALKRIEEGSFGTCQECGEEIDIRRLEARPTATHCVHCKEEQERREQIHIDSHRSLGKSRLRLV